MNPTGNSDFGSAVHSSFSEPRLQVVECHACGHTHECADNAENTQCTHCGQPISFANITISSSVSRKIDTRGIVRVEKRGNLFTPLTVCRNAVIHGMISGSLCCRGKVTIHGSGNFPVKIETAELLIPGGADVVCPFPIHAHRVVVRGILRAPLLVESMLEVLRSGHVEGAVCARAVHVDRGGELRGQVRVGPGPLPRPSHEIEKSVATLRALPGRRFGNHRPVYPGRR